MIWSLIKPTPTSEHYWSLLNEDLSVVVSFLQLLCTYSLQLPPVVTTLLILALLFSSALLVTWLAGGKLQMSTAIVWNSENGP